MQQRTGFREAIYSTQAGQPLLAPVESLFDVQSGRHISQPLNQVEAPLDSRTGRVFHRMGEVDQSFVYRTGRQILKHPDQEEALFDPHTGNRIVEHPVQVKAVSDTRTGHRIVRLPAPVEAIFDPHTGQRLVDHLPGQACIQPSAVRLGTVRGDIQTVARDESTRSETPLVEQSPVHDSRRVIQHTEHTGGH